MKILFFTILLAHSVIHSQEFEEVFFSKKKCHARGITADFNFIYVSTNIGTVIKIKPESKKYWTLFDTKKSKGELRDIELVNNQIIAMQSSDSGLVYSLSDKKSTMFNGVFLDGMDFYEKNGFLMGDPINDTFSLFHSTNGGKSWLPCAGRVYSEKGEAGFAASGSTVHCLNDSSFMFVSGGMNSRIFRTTNSGKSWLQNSIPFQHSESSGPFSITYLDNEYYITVGGNYLNPSDTSSNCYITNNSGRTWTSPKKHPKGYRSCIINHKNILFTCGTNGLDYSLDRGLNWIAFNHLNYLSLTIYRDKLVATTNSNSIHLIDFNLFKP
jgi:hypothetical protein